MEKRYIQYGCGFKSPLTWSNYDASPTLRFERIPFIGKLYTKNKSRFPVNVKYGDIVKGLPVPPGSCNGVFASHVLEHLALDDFRTALKNTYRILISGGIFRLVVPDLEAYARAYIDSEKREAAVVFMKDTSLGSSSRPGTLYGFLKSWIGNSRHLWMWDYKSLEQELESAGFKEIRRCNYGDSADPAFNEVEEPERFVNAVSVECRKP